MGAALRAPPADTIPGRLPALQRGRRSQGPAHAEPCLRGTRRRPGGRTDSQRRRTSTAPDRLFAAYTVEMVLREVILPYLHSLGERWEAGEVSVAHEHFASNLLRGRLLGLAQGWGQGRGPGAILACVPGEHHELGLLAFGVALHRRGWRITYLGTDSPIDAVADIAPSLAPK